MTVELVYLPEVSAQLKWDVSEESDYIDILISTARELCESATKRACVVKQQTIALDSFPSNNAPIEIKNPPLRSIDSFVYTDLNGAEQTLVEDTDFKVIYSLHDPVQPSKVVPMYGTDWPDTLDFYEAVKITFTCGYGTIGEETVALPTALKQWMLINIANLYEHRETIQIVPRMSLIEIPTLADVLLGNYVVYKL